MKILPVGAELFDGGRWTDRRDESSQFCESAKTPNNLCI